MSIQMKSYKIQPETSYDNRAYNANSDDVLPNLPITNQPVISTIDSTLKNGEVNKNELPSNDALQQIDIAKYESSTESEYPNAFYRTIYRIQTIPKDFFQLHQRTIWRVFAIILLLLYAVYFSYAMYYGRNNRNEAYIRLLWVTCVVVFVMFVCQLWKTFKMPIKTAMQPIASFTGRYGTAISWVIVFIMIGGAFTYIVIDVVVISESPYNLVSGTGLAFYIIFCFIFSFNPAKVRWRPVVWGLAIQLVFGIIILRWSFGYQAFKWLGDRVKEFLAHTNAGAAFVFGAKYTDHFFAFSVLPVIIFFSTFISILYYLGVMQRVVRVVAVVMQACMGTTAGESLNASGNIFIGQTEAPLMIAPLLPDMTRSELHAVMTGGFATIAGSVLAAYIGFGVPANHLISASVMSAPAALAIAKLFYPETEVSKTTSNDVAEMGESQDRSIVEAATNGASQAISLVANIAANLIAFLALLAFVNATLTWFGERVGIQNLTLQVIFSYLLWPFAIVMGVDVADCRKVAEMLGNKTFLNEFIAYRGLGDIIRNRQALEGHIRLGGNYTHVGDNIHLLGVGPYGNETSLLYNGVISRRSAVIATYALCGFANLGSIGIQLGGLGALVPSRKLDLAAVVVRAMIAGNIACFMTACVAGLLYQDSLERRSSSFFWIG